MKPELVNQARSLWENLLQGEKSLEPRATVTIAPSQQAKSQIVLRTIGVSGDSATLFAMDDEPTQSSKTLPSSYSSDETNNEMHFELVQEIARGGMGIVFRGRQLSLERDVAIKRSLSSENSDSQERFLNEAKVTAYLQHPNIIPVHDLGESKDGNCLMVMKLLGGSSWHSLLYPVGSKSILSIDQSIDILLKVCDAVSYAHSRGIIHCDLKPENVMVGEFGEVILMDWGVAVDIESPPDKAARGLRPSEITGPFGTPSHMSPEQAIGDGEAIKPHTDVYLLGSILYEILTGKPPHQGESIIALISHAMIGDPLEYPSSTPKALRAICDKATALLPEDRYQSATELQSAIRDHLKHRETRRFLQACAAFLISFLALGALVSLLWLNQLKLNEAQELRFRSHLLAVDLQKGSDDLTSAARAYVMTGDSTYEERYRNILAIRNGEAPRNDGRQISLRALMAELGFSKKEFALLERSENQSNDLVVQEEIAMHAVKGQFQDANGNFSRSGAPDMKLAQQLMFNADYRSAKRRIMAPIDEFEAVLNARTKIMVHSYQKRSNLLLSLVGLLLTVLSLATILITVRLARSVKKR